MLVTVQVKLNKAVEKVVQISSNEIEVHIHASPEKGKANLAVIALVAEYFSTAKSAVQIIRGGKSKVKVIEILES